MSSYNRIQVSTADGFLLNGLYSSGDKEKSAVILIHGFVSDFYSHNFYHSITQTLSAQGFASILMQTRGTGIQTEVLKKDGNVEYLGSYYERIEDSHLDISAFVKFLLDNGYKKVILAGHSLGTIKGVRYLFEGEYKDKISKLILLAPFDKNAFMEVKAPGKWHEFVEIAKKKVDSGLGREIVPVPEYEDFAMSYTTFYSWYKKDDLNCMWDFYKKDYTFPVLQKINIPVKVILGEKDEFIAYEALGTTPEDNLNIIKKYIKDCETVLIRDSTHCYPGHEEEVAQEVAKFLNL